MLGLDIYKSYWGSKNKFNFNEGLGLVYERLLLAEGLVVLSKKYNVKNVLEVPTRGMQGIPALNSVSLAQAGLSVSLVDHDESYLKEAKKIWDYLNLPSDFVLSDYEKLPFSNNSFNLVWNFASLWRLKDFERVITEMVRVSNDLILIYIPNRWQPGYWLGKYFLNKNYFKGLNFKALSASRIKDCFKRNDCRIVEEGVFDIPIWPDTCVPILDVLSKLKIRKPKESVSWHWSSINYFSGKDKDMINKIKKLSFLEKLPIYWRFKLCWAHHRYILVKKI